MMRNLLLTTALVAAAGSASAADLGARVVQPAPAPYVAAPIFTWTGFYVGLNAGAGFNNKSSSPFIPNGYSIVGGGFGANGNNDAGFTGGVQAGYNWQITPLFVVGVEADINYLDRGNNGGDVLVRNSNTFTFHRGDANNWFGTVRGRVGLAFDRFLPYVTGGWAFGGKQGGFSASYVDATGTHFLSNNGDSGSSSGWTLGGGVEYAFTNNMSFKVEYLHVKLGNNNSQFAVAGTGANTQFVTFRDSNKFDVVRAGVNWRF